MEYSERLISASDTGVTTLKRSSSSYPNLRQDVRKNDNEDRFRFYDDFELNRYRSSTNCRDQVHELRRRCRSDFEECETKIIPVDTFVSPPLPAPSPPPASRHKPRRTYQADGEEKVKDQADQFKQIKSSLPVTPPLPPPLVEMGNIAEVKHEKLERRRSNPSKEIKMVLDSSRKKKKKIKLKDHNHQQECPLHSPPAHYSIIPSPPSPPSPPPPSLPSLVFQKYDLFRKCGKSKQIHSVPTSTFSLSIRLSKQNTEIPPPPPPLPRTPPQSKPPPSAPPPEPSRRRVTTDSGMPPSPTYVNTNSYCEEKMNNGGQLPLIPMQPPPPPLSFKITQIFEKTDIDVSSSKDDVATDSMMEDPDVNVKAETFIARLKDGWKLEKITMKDKLNHITSS
ncbi:formin-like protein 14 [Hibiscus syriacus]|uniref:formin-like protein 14 n=1 Tax=Hibiscus syriacus TaxID=106335 RepID=UPI00192151A8|nr:formin-like protein 14 [Hibiscus syriacus]